MKKGFLCLLAIVSLGIGLVRLKNLLTADQISYLESVHKSR